MYRQVRVRQPLLYDMLQALGKGGDFVVLKIPLIVDVVQSRFSLVSVGAQVYGQRCLFVIVRRFDGVGGCLAEAQQVIVALIGERQIEQLGTLGTA